MTSKTIAVTILNNGSICAIPIEFDPKVVFGKLRAPVKVTIKDFTFRSTIARMGGKTFIPVRKDNREAAAIEVGDNVIVHIEQDGDIRAIEPPEDLANALKTRSNLWEAWEKLSYTIQRESVESILGAKKSDTRARRIKTVIEMVAQKT